MASRRLAVWLALGICGTPAPLPWGAGVASEIHEISVWLADPTADGLNARDRFRSGLPANLPGAGSGRGSADESAPAGPLALLSFYGPASEQLEVDLRVSAGRFLAHYPPARKRNQRLSWYDATLQPSLEKSQRLAYVPKQHWMRAARQGSGLYVKVESRVERFLTYQAELKQPLPVGLQGGPDSYQIENRTSAPLLDVLISVATPNGRRLGWLERLPAGKPRPTKPAAEAGKKRDLQPADGESADEEKQAAPPSAMLTMANPAAPGTGAESLTRRLRAAGLQDWECQLLVDELSPYLFESDGLVVLLRLPSAALDDWLPLEVYPPPDKIVRVGLVLVRNVDPAVALDVDRLITQLGDPVFAVRQTAHEHLLDLGSVAEPALKRARKHDDPEIALRATRILRQHGAAAP